ncbi:phosphotransferase system, enzyme I, PtsI [Acetitomaculum ruminis DSM 5522]|uniref:Phosphoenolpyruvate-protein phosphotransferase n=1 Tax=Acetitomaculum ruminis DSM 5522 TaxID=1120918 RepID=A0A1I0YT31_9FIRM|nr:phosphoenolpyruvate--protein phosphotransferase [Acetitomaculum ruminis]SFB16454.1 phosphotransferase system, enzyme I, PtsI [Acetitomaculum ruminis DSM 5522]
MSKCISGKIVYDGIAVGKIYYYGVKASVVKRSKIDDANAEIERYKKARDQAIDELNDIYEKALVEVGEANAAIFETHAMLLDDDDYNDSVYNIIETQMVNAEYAVATTADNFAKMFSEMEDEYFRARSADMIDISERVIRVLENRKEDEGLTSPSIVIAENLAPSETVQLDKSCLLGFVTHQGSVNSHTAILARAMNIPALVEIEIDPEWNGKMGIIDGNEGIFIVDPTSQELDKYNKKLLEQKEKQQLLQQYKGKETISKSGKKIKLFANIGNVSDVAAALENDAEGIGLFRSEFLYLGTDDYPSEEEQFQAYKTVAEMMAGKLVVIRTLDIGADKQVDYFDLEKEDNPAMGLRAIRLCLTRPEIFKTQLRALIRASAYGNIAIMYPMIISVDEVRRIKDLVEEVKKELDAAGVGYGKFSQGIMIETPASAVISDLLAKEVDFFSIGTNDLIQYTLAADRQNPKLELFTDTHHEAVLRLIKMAIDNGHKEGIWVGICGELGADTTLTSRFLEMGIDELSVSSSFLLKVRRQVIEGD